MGLSSNRPQPCQVSSDSSIPLIPRQVFFGNPDHQTVRQSQDGKWIAYMAPHQGVLNIWVAEVNNLKEAKPITFDKKRGIRYYWWAATNEHIIYCQDNDGDEDFHLYCVDLGSGNTRDLTPFPKTQARLHKVSPSFPSELLITLNNRNPSFHDLYRVNLKTGDLRLLYENNEFTKFICDDQLNLRLAQRDRKDGGFDMLKKVDKGWEPFLSISHEDRRNFITFDFNEEMTHLYLCDSRGRDKAALVSIALHDKTVEVIATNDKADIDTILLHPTKKVVQGVISTYQREEWQVFDDDVARDLAYIRQQSGGDVYVWTHTLKDDQWIISAEFDNGPLQYYLYQREGQKLIHLFSDRQSLEGLPLCKMHPLEISTRDGLSLVSYLTVPRQADPQQNGRPYQPIPLVLLVHGGPQSRDFWECDAEHQWLANRGYAVLSVNYRGSSGFGKSFVNRGDGEWSRKMHDDLIDAVNWAVQNGIADKTKIAIMGGSYGGYAALVGLSFTPDVFACGVDMVGPSNLATLLATIPPYWLPIVDSYKKCLGGDLDSEQGKRELEARSPLFKCEQIKKPLLIAHGANDPRVKQAESEQIVAALKSKNIPVTYLLYPDEGHGFARPENKLSYYAIVEAFLAQHLRGRKEPINNDFQGSSLTVVEDVGKFCDRTFSSESSAILVKNGS